MLSLMLSPWFFVIIVFGLDEAGFKGKAVVLLLILVRLLIGLALRTSLLLLLYVLSICCWMLLKFIGKVLIVVVIKLLVRDLGDI